MNILKKWDDYAKKHLLNRKIVKVRYLTKEELSNLGWYESTLVIELDDGKLIFPSKDDEANGPGALQGQTAKGNALVFPTIRESLL